MNKESAPDVIDEFVSGLSTKETQRAYRSDLRRFFEKETVDLAELDRVKARDVQAFLRSLADLGRTKGTQRRFLAALRSFYDWLMTEGRCDRNPARHPDVEPRAIDQPSSKPGRLTTEELHDLMKAAGERRTALRDQALILTIVYGALRRSEVAALSVDDVRPLGRHWVLDLDGPTSGGGYVRIPERLVELLDTVTDSYGIESGALWRSASNRSRGEPLTPSAIYRIVREIGRRADVGAVSIDRLRRTGLSLAFQGGANISQVRAHGRYGENTDIANLEDDDPRSGGLSDSAVQYIRLDLRDLAEPE